MLWLKIRKRANRPTSEHNVTITGTLGKPALGPSAEPTLAGVCIVYFPDNDREKYCVLVVVE